MNDFSHHTSAELQSMIDELQHTL
ncbi:MAG: hypothetical protein RIQ52_533, partial [Pseudomonadota bacterium]